MDIRVLRENEKDVYVERLLAFSKCLIALTSLIIAISQMIK